MIVEIRPGEGGDDAANFSRELADCVSNLLRRHSIEYERTIGDQRAIRIRSAQLCPVVRTLAGIHRIQRIPNNDRRGRRHTSTATMVVLGERDVPRVHLSESDLRIETKRGTGAGGQHRNKTDSAVQITHLPTGLVVQIDSGRSQHQNLERARRVLLERLQAQAEARFYRGINALRTQQVESPERSFKHFTWNTQRNEVVCHAEGTRRLDLDKLQKGRMEER